jgi:hypothetical protein
MTPRRSLVWLVAGALVVLLARTIGYAAMPSPLAGLYAHRAGGPELPEIALVALSLGAAVAIAVCWLTALGVRERRLLERRTLASPLPPLRPGAIVLRAGMLWAVAAPAAGLLEAYIHWRAGLGWHGLHCLVGPVHRDLIPIVGALSLVASAAIAAADHVLAWMRRTFALVGGLNVRLVLLPAIPEPVESSALRVRVRAPRVGGARAPPSVA